MQLMHTVTSLPEKYCNQKFQTKKFIQTVSGINLWAVACYYIYILDSKFMFKILIQRVLD